MPDKNDDKFLDDLLDAGLRQFSAGPPRDGLEGRTIAVLRAAASPRPHRYWVWAWAGGLAAAAIIGFALVRHPSPPLGPQGPSSAKANPVAAPPPLSRNVGPNGSASDDRVGRPGAQHAKRIVKPQRPEQFPTPRPLSDQERLLLVYVSTLTPEEAKRISIQDQAAESEIPVLAVAALQIQPLEGEQLTPEKK